MGDWAAVLRELPKRVGDCMERFQAEGIRGADLVFACIGPALEIFSRYRKVETAEGREVTLPEFLEKVWEVVGRTALEQVLGTAEAKARNGIAGALEEDARLTALFLWTLQSTNGRSPSPSAPLPEGEGEEEEAEDEEEEGEDARATKRPRGLTLIFDVVRRFLTPLRPALACSRRHAAAPLPHTFRTEAAATIMVPNRIGRVAFLRFEKTAKNFAGMILMVFTRHYLILATCLGGSPTEPRRTSEQFDFVSGLRCGANPVPWLNRPCQ